MLAGFHRHGAHENGPAFAVNLFHLIKHRLIFFLGAEVNGIIAIFAHANLIGGDDEHAHTVNIKKLVGLGLGGASHPGEFEIQPEIILNGNGGVSLRLGFDADQLIVIFADPDPPTDLFQRFHFLHLHFEVGARGEIDDECLMSVDGLAGPNGELVELKDLIQSSLLVSKSFPFARFKFRLDRHPPFPGFPGILADALGLFPVLLAKPGFFNPLSVFRDQPAVDDLISG